MQKSKKLDLFSGPVLIVIAAALWGLDGILRRFLGTLPPVTIVFLEHVFGFILLIPFIWKSFGKEKLSKKEWWAIILVSILSGLLGTLWFTTALLKTQFISFSVVFLLQKLQPIFAITSARIFLKEMISRNFWPWAGLAMLSAYFVTFPKGIVNLSTGAGTLTAALFAIGAAFAWGSSTAFSKIALKNHSASFMTGLRFLLTILFAGVALIIFGKAGTLVTLHGKEILGLVVVALSSGMVGLFIYYRGLKNTPVSVSTILELFYPLIAVFIDFFLYHNTLAVSQYVAAVVLLFAMYRVGKLAHEANPNEV